MALSAGNRLGPYEIVELLGAGGMGEVYRATDTKLRREVAIKILPPEVSGDPERLARFQREAHLLASLNHSNIAAIYGLEEADGSPFLVLELVEGEDLAERLKRGPILVAEALGIARQVAEALEEAHEKGVVHRDLKPANLKLTPDGKVKVLDFGLAKAYEGGATSGGSSADLSQSPTLAHSGTAAGVILGTAAYMSPEQARGKPIDKRADVWAFGVVLFEMLTGQPLFTGETVSDVLAAVMRDDPDWSKLPDTSPPSLRRLLRLCLQRVPRERLHDIADARLELEDVLKGGTDDSGHPQRDDHRGATEPRLRLRQGWLPGVAGLLIGGLASGLVFKGVTSDPATPSAVHFEFATHAGTDAALLFGRFPVPSPDGRYVAFQGDKRLWVRSLDAPQGRPLPGTEGGMLPFWSPDGAWIGFFTGSELRKVSLDGGSVHRLCALPAGASFGGTWGHDGTIVFSSGGLLGRLFAVAAGGGDARPLTALDEARGETGHLWPRFLPDGRHLAFLVQSARDEGQGFHVASLDAPHERRRLLPEGTRFAFSSGHLLFLQDGTLLAQRFDAGSLEVSGEPTPVVQNVAAWAGNGAWGWFDASPSGVLAYLDTGVQVFRLTWVDRTGERLATVGDPGPYGQIVLSADERRVAFERGSDIWVMDISRGVASRVTTELATPEDPVWSPDGQELIFTSNSPDTPGFFRKALGPGASATPLLESSEFWSEDWSRDGGILLYIERNDAVWALPLEADGPPELVLKTGARLDEPHLSPDGRWLAYISDESGDWEVYVEPFRRPGERVRVSTHGGGQPRWRGDGGELYFTSPSRHLMAAEVGVAGDRLEVGLPTELFEMDLVVRPQVDDYAVAEDGQRFLVKTRAEGSVDASFHVVVNWPSLLE